MTKKYICEKCNFETTNKIRYENHIETKKHKNLEDESRLHYTCNKCNKIYNTNVSLWRHKKNCKVIPQTYSDKDVIKEMQDKINVLENIIMEHIKKEPINVAINNNNSNNNSGNFNINLFLNEKCKNAINIKEFIRQVLFDFNDLVTIENKGYVDGMAEVIQNKLENHSIYERPIHYEVKNDKDKSIHIKYKDEWKTETDKKKPLLMKTMEKLDERVYDVYRGVKETISKEEHPRMERELMKGSYTTNREEVSTKVLEKIKIEPTNL